MLLIETFGIYNLVVVTKDYLSHERNKPNENADIAEKPVLFYIFIFVLRGAACQIY